MSANFSQRFNSVFVNIIGTEGGYVNSPNDPGGETKYGISKRSYPDLDIKNLTLEKAKEIYWYDFWMKLRLDMIAPSLDEFIFDFAVNSGVGTVARMIQRAIGVLPDGIIGERTVAALKSCDGMALARLLFVERAIIFAKAKENVFQENSHGWYARLFDQTRLLLAGSK